MVNSHKIISCLLALGFVSPGSAGYNRTSQTVTYTPLHEEWIDEESNSNVTLSAKFDLINSAYASLYDKEETTDLSKRTSITVIAEAATVIGGTATVIIAANSGVSIYKYIAGIMKSKSDDNSCTLTWGTDTGDGYVEGYAYEATTTGSNCETTAEKKTMVKAVEKCANYLHDSGATRGCCKMNHGGGTWRGHLRLSAEPTKYPAHSVTC
ncbi:hypothetical protein N7466_006823 [Penicillium verhagenii]|uniref:uncharacterized protein n=1 Tax=Penicillium verhagenii TaxID=1562060 RepID=UPI0025458AF0|nr:uncharacterized protein N7466_006823 [Penicillium verhagenii]KAJ5927867.1 hypothetical protein N7466_006823 [Penicillium verhagenii]